MQRFQETSRNDFAALRHKVIVLDKRIIEHKQDSAFNTNGDFGSQTMRDSHAMGSIYASSKFSPPRRARGASGSPFREEGEWRQIQALLEVGRVSEAFSRAVSKTNDLLLIKLMGKTGLILS